MKTLYLIDGHAQFFRAFHAIRTPMSSPVTKEPTNATFGFVGMMLKLFREYRPDYVVVAIDVSGDRETFRSEIYPEYKATRTEAPESFGPQVDRCVAVLKEIGVPVVFAEGFEADDVIATLATRVADAGVAVRIVSKDKDLKQLLRGGTGLRPVSAGASDEASIAAHSAPSAPIELFDIHTDLRIDPAHLMAEQGIRPDQVIDMLTLMGDTVDNVPGVPGIGPKTAAELIQKYGTLDNLIAHAAEIPGKRGEKLREAIPRLPLSKRLITLRHDVAVDMPLESAAVGRFDLAKLIPICKELGFNRYQDEVRTLLGQPAEAKAGVDAAPRDRWSPLITFREATLSRTRPLRPAEGWLVTPLHAHLLPDGRALLHGEMKNTVPVERDTPFDLIGNDMFWTVDTAAPEPASDATVVVRPALPWTRWVGVPDGTQTDPAGGHGDAVDTELLFCGGTTWLADGRLFYVGGTGIYTRAPAQPHHPPTNGVYEGGTWKTAFFDPRMPVEGAQGFSVGPPTRQGMRWYGTAARLADGDVVVVSGFYDTVYYAHTGVERLDVRRNAWRELVPSLGARRDIPREDPRAGLSSHPEDYPHVFTLPTPLPASHPAAGGISRELIVLGRAGDISFLSVEAGEGTGRIARDARWQRPNDPSAPTDERTHGASSVLLPDGRIGVASGSDSPGIGQRFDVFDPRPDSPAFGTWRSIPLCVAPGACHARVHGSAVLMPDGQVLLMAGRKTNERAPGDPRAPLWIDPEAGTVRAGTPWSEEDVRGYHNVALLTLDGRVLIGGGRSYRWSRCDRYGAEYCEDERPDMRWYSPPYLDPALAPLRPRITADPRATSGAALPRDLDVPVLGYDGTYDVPVATERAAGCDAGLRAVLMGLPTQTHSFDAGQRLVPL
ncbi:MAG: hypothetical protein J0L61_06060, partial [Planctomycetes bacterium]|nr:hypothetical protein [Planctomycetota bacterium]